MEFVSVRTTKEPYHKLLSENLQKPRGDFFLLTRNATKYTSSEVANRKCFLKKQQLYVTQILDSLLITLFCLREAANVPLFERTEHI